MKFTCELLPLLTACRAASSAVKRSHVPIMDCLRILAVDNTLRITGSNYDTTITAALEAAVTGPGETVVNCAPLLKWLDACPKGGLVSGENTGAMQLSCGKNVVTFSTFDARDFYAGEAVAGVEIEGALAAMSAVSVFCAKEETRYYLRGVFLGKDCVAMDGNVLGFLPDINGPGVIVPQESIDVIARVAPGARFFATDTTWRAESEGITLTGKMIDGTFPDCTRIMQPEIMPLCAVSCDGLVAAVRSVALGVAPSVFLTGGAETITARANSAMAGVDLATAETPCEGLAQWATALGVSPLTRALGPFAGKSIDLGWNGSALILQSGSAPLVMLMPYVSPENRMPVK